MNLLIKKEKIENFFKITRKEFFLRFYSIIKAVFLLLFLFFIIFSFIGKTQAQPVEIGTSVSAIVEGEAPPIPPGGGPSFYYTDVIFKGTAYPNAFITVLRNNTVAKTGLADTSGNFSLKLTGIPEGIWQFSLRAEDQDNRISPTISFTTSLARDTTTTFSNIFFPPTVELSSDKISQGKNLDIFGYSAPKSEIDIFIDSLANISKKTQADADGQWFYSFDSSVLKNEGYYNIKVKAVFPDGLISDFSKILQFYLIRIRPLCAGADLNQDGQVDMVDFSILLYWWETDDDCADQNNDGTVDLTDFSIMMYFWTG